MTTTIPHFPLTKDYFHPSGFRAAEGVTRAVLTPVSGIPYRRGGRTTTAQKVGKRYEAKVFQRLQEVPGILIAPWLRFDDASGGGRLCQPDALLFERSRLRVTIFEVKYTHTILAWWQLAKLYAPVVSVLEGSPELRLVEITKSFDPAVRFPVEMRLFFSMEELLTEPWKPNVVEVLQCSK